MGSRQFRDFISFGVDKSTRIIDVTFQGSIEFWLMQKLRVLTMCWGDSHVDLFERGCLKSLTWAKNKAALSGATWSFATDQKNVERAEKLIWNSLDVQFEPFVMPEKLTLNQLGEIETSRLDMNYSLLHTLCREIQICLQTGSKLLMAPPDTLFGDGTIPNLLTIGEQIGTCVAVPHVRVLPELLNHLDEPLENAELCDLAFKNLHESWVSAESGSEHLNSLVGGVHYKRLTEGLYSVQHRLPTVFLSGFIPQDLIFFYEQSSFGSYDHSWPGDRLVRQERQRTVGSSDACFIVEITEAEKNIPPRVPQGAINPEQPDLFHLDRVHNSVNRLFSCIFRAEAHEKV